MRPTSSLPARLLALAAAALATTTAMTVTAGPASAAGDDYPFRADTTHGADDWGFTKRQCVSFVAWRMAQRDHALDNATQQWGSALTWDDTARRLGYGIGSTPVPGSVAHWDADEASPVWTGGSARPNGTMRAGDDGHVGYVQRVFADGSVSVAHYNGKGDRAYSTVRVRAPRYLYVSVAGPA